MKSLKDLQNLRKCINELICIPSRIAYNYTIHMIEFKTICWFSFLSKDQTIINSNIYTPEHPFSENPFKVKT